MHYHKEKNHLVIEIDERIQGMTLLEFFHYLHLSKKTIHLLRQNKDYTLNNTYVDYQTILKDKDILSIKAYEQGRDFIEEESSLEIIYEDDLLCVVNKPSNLIIHPDDKSKVFQAIGKAMATDGECDLEIRTIVHKNEYKWCKFNAAIQKYDEDNTPIFHAMITDITRIKEAEEEADKMSDMLVEMFKNLPDPIFCTDTQDIWQLQIVSEDFIKFLGFTRFHIFEEHKGRLDDFVSEREAKFIEAQIKKQIAEGKSTTVSRYSVRTKSGRFIVVEDRRKLVRQADGSYSMICRLKNVTNTYSEMF